MAGSKRKGGDKGDITVAAFDLKCVCGHCKTCKGREATRRWRERHREELRQRDRERYHADLEAARARLREWRRRNPEKALAADRRQRAARREQIAVDDRERRARWPEKAAARAAINNAIKEGRLTRQPCEVCGAERAQAHHDDYARPLDVRWLCTTHHAEVHRLEVAA